MARFIKERELLLSKTPDSLVFIGYKKVEHCLMRVIDYDHDSYQELERIHVRDFPEIPDSKGEHNIRWISVYGLHDTTSIEEIGQLFSIDQLTLKNIINTGLRPICHEFDKYLYVSIKLVHFSPQENTIDSDQLGVLIGKDYILTFHERPVDLFGPLRKQLKDQNSKLRKSGIEYLSYCILESIADSYLQTAECIGTKIEEFEHRLHSGSVSKTLQQIGMCKKTIHFLIRNISPVCEFIGEVNPYERSLLQPVIDPLFKDLRNQFVMVRETLETYNDILSDYIGICHTHINSKILHVLAIIVTAFILAVLLGVYIVTFSTIPEQFEMSNHLLLWGITIFVLLIIGYNFKYMKNVFRIFLKR